VGHPPWALPKLHHDPLGGVPPLAVAHKMGRLRRNIKITHFPESEHDPKRYPDSGINDTNSDLLRNMLYKSMPVTKMLLPTLSLVYPDKVAPVQAERVHVDKLKHVAIDDGRNDDKTKCGKRVQRRKHLIKLKKCFERDNTVEFVQKPSPLPLSKYNEREGEDGGEFASYIEPEPTPLTDWDIISHERVSHNDDDDHQHDETHYHFHGCKYKTPDLARYIKHRQVLGEYDIFSGTAQKPDFLEDEPGEDDEEDPEDSDNEEEIIPVPAENVGGEATGELHDGEHHSLHGSPRKSVSHAALRNPSLVHIHRHSKADVGAGGGDVIVEESTSKILSVSETESWVMTWTYAGHSWLESREVNQKLLDNARSHFDGNNTNHKSFVDKHKPGQTKEPAEVMSQSQQDRRNQYKSQQQIIQQKNARIPESFRIALPTMPKIMKGSWRGMSGHFDLVFDNPTLPINYY